MTSAPAAVELEGLSFSYGTTKVLDCADFLLEPGCFCVLEGANGAGKSTLLRLMLGELEPQEGSVKVLGRTPSHGHFDGSIGYVPQQAPEDLRRFPVTVWELVLSGLYASSHPLLPYRSGHRKRAAQAIESAGLRGFEKHLAGELSGGQFQRALLARALVCRPELLILDEPTSSLDEQSTRTLVGSVAQASQETGTAALMVTHDLARLPHLYSRIVELHDGKLFDLRKG